MSLARSRRPVFGIALKDAGLAALIAAGLFLPMVGLRTDVGPTGALFLRTRWTDVLLLMTIVFAGRFLMRLWQEWRAGRPGLGVSKRLAGPLSRSGRFVAPVILLFAVLLPVIPGIGRYELDLGILVLTYVMLGWGLNIVVGLAGCSISATSPSTRSAPIPMRCCPEFRPFLLGLPAAGGHPLGLRGVLLGFPVLRLRGDYLAIVTLGFGEIIRLILLNWASLTGGPNGISGIPRPNFFGLTFTAGGGPGSFADFFGLEPSPTHRVVFLYYLILGLALLTNWVTLRLRRQPLGRAWEAMREDEIACRSLGINIITTKLTAFALGAMFGGFAGAFFATRQAFISPESFSFIESAIILAIVVLGGLGSQLGVAIAALVLIGGFEVFRDLQEWRMLVFGAAMVLIMIWKPRGLVGSRTPSIALGEKRTISAAMVAEGRG
jgi:branched-chain amino acid transport system permease protein